MHIKVNKNYSHHFSLHFDFEEATMQLLILSTIFAAFCGSVLSKSASKGIELECRFRTDEIQDISGMKHKFKIFYLIHSKNLDEYTCDVQNENLITSKDDRTITSIVGQNKKGFTDSDVLRFTSIHKTVNYFPKDITKFYKNIQIVEIYSGDLKEITKDDLKPFGENLKVLTLLYNHIEVIESNLFQFNPNLKDVNLGNNRIRHIESGGLNGLQKLDNKLISEVFFNRKAFEFERNPCKQLDTVDETEIKCKDFVTTTGVN